MKLTTAEQEAARRCAQKRLADALASKAKDRFGTDSEQNHYWGALGEIALAKYIVTQWTCTSKTWATRDVGRYEVRSVPPSTRAYIKAKHNDPPDRAIALVIFRSDSEAEVVGWLTADEVRRLGSLEDPGARGAPAYFLRDLSRLHKVFPEIRMPWDKSESKLLSHPDELDATVYFPLAQNENGAVEVMWSICPDCGGEYIVHADHLVSTEHEKWFARTQLLESQMTIPEEPQPEIYKYTKKPPRIDFGINAICPRCKAARKKAYTDGHGNFHPEEMDCMEPGNRKIKCRRCNGFGVVPNVGPVNTVTE